MKSMKKLISLVCLVALLMSTVVTFTASAEAAVYDTPVNSALWTDPNFETDVAYSFAFVGDTQYITCGDYYNGTTKLNTIYKYIADTAAERKLAHVFVLGDMTDLGYKNDGNLAGAYYTTPLTGEWSIVNTAISQLNGVVPYSLCRGNHDDYMMDDYFNVDTYIEQFTTSTYQYRNSAYTGTYQNGGFHSDSTAKWSDAKAGENTYDKNRVPANTNGYVYWSAINGYHEESIVNSWKTLNIAGTDYLFITIDFNPTTEVLNWVDQKLAAYPNHKAIITTHSYLVQSGEVNTNDNGSTMYLFGNTGKQLWENVLSKHANVFMVVSGHTGTGQLAYSYNEGVNGNQVLQVLVDPQALDVKDTGKGTIDSTDAGCQDTGLVLYMNFSSDGKRINFDYYSPLLNKFLKYNNHTIYIEPDESVNKDKNINLSALENCGQINTYLTYKTTVAPDYTDKTIGENEYSFKRVTEANNTNQMEGTLTEYFSYDDNYLYYAFTATQLQSGQTYQINLKPNYDWIDTLNSGEHWPRYQIRFRINDAGEITKSAPVNFVSDTWGDGDESANMSYCRWDKDVFISGKRDKSTGVNTFELKIRKAYIAENTPEKELQCLAYMLYLGDRSGVDTDMWHRFDYKVDGVANSALKALGLTENLYNYMIFVDEPISTRSTASVRISSTNSGLRFKSDVITAQLNYFRKNYKSVEIGTLIAPTDTLVDGVLNHDIGVENVNYIDVKATVDKPLEDDHDGITVYAGSIVDMNPKNLDRDFSAVGYIKVTDNNDKVTYYYSKTVATRNVSDVAEAAFFDVKATSQAEYVHEVTVEGDVAKGFYSPYTKGQRAIIKALIVEKTNDENDPTTPDIFD